MAFTFYSLDTNSDSITDEHVRFYSYIKVIKLRI